MSERFVILSRSPWKESLRCGGGAIAHSVGALHARPTGSWHKHTSRWRRHAAPSTLAHNDGRLRR